MDTEMKVNELEQVNGGNFLDDVKDVLKKFIPNPFAPRPREAYLPDYSGTRDCQNKVITPNSFPRAVLKSESIDQSSMNTDKIWHGIPIKLVESCAIFMPKML